MADEKTTLDRIHTINDSISGLRSSRYFPTNLDTARLPLATCVPSAARYNGGRGEARRNIVRDYRLIVWVGSFTMGLPTQSAQEAAEALFPLIREAYHERPRLEYYDSGVINTEYAELTEDTGITEWPGTTLAAIVFTLSVTSIEFT